MTQEKKGRGRPKVYKDYTAKSLRIAADLVEIINAQSNQTAFVEKAIRTYIERKKYCPFTLKELRLSHGLSQQELADELGLLQAEISSVETEGEATVVQGAKFGSFFLGFKLKERDKVNYSPLRKFRNNKNLSQAKLASAIGSYANVISNLENRHAKMTKNLAERLAKVLDCDPQDLLEENKE